jgi:hypothetical protein
MSAPLPKRLSRFARGLSIFPDEVAQALGPLAERIALLLGTPGTRPSEVGEPDGISGLAHRGSYERLLGSEWALLDVMPDEFYRRATSGEHLFFDTARRSSGKSQRAFALFATGPFELGAARVAHLAALVTAQMRADAQRATLRFGVLEDAPTLFDTVDARHVKRLLEARRLTPARAEDFVRWCAALSSEGATADDEVLVVCGPRTAEALRGAGALLLVVEEQDDARALTVEVRARDAAPRRAVLELPSDDVVTRTLRDPFESRVQSKKGGALKRVVLKTSASLAGARLVCTRNAVGGDHVVIVLEDRLVAFARMRAGLSGGSKKPMTLEVPAGVRVVGATTMGGAPVALVADGDGVRFFGRATPTLHGRALSHPGLRSTSEAYDACVLSDELLVLLTEAGDAFRVHLPGKSGRELRVDVVLEGALLAGICDPAAGKRALAALLQDPALRGRWRKVWVAPDGALRPSQRGAHERVFAGELRVLSTVVHGIAAFALEQAERTWELDDGKSKIQVPSGQDVFGLTRHPGSGGATPALWTLDRKRNCIDLVPSTSTSRFLFAKRIVDVVANPTHPHAIVLLEDGALVTCCHDTGRRARLGTIEVAP